MFSFFRRLPRLCVRVCESHHHHRNTKINKNKAPKSIFLWFQKYENEIKTLYELLIAIIFGWLIYLSDINTCTRLIRSIYFSSFYFHFFSIFLLFEMIKWGFTVNQIGLNYRCNMRGLYSICENENNVILKLVTLVFTIL